MNRDFSKLDRKKLQYEDIVKVKWKTIQYLVENKKEQMDMLTKNMKQLIQEVKKEMRRKRPTGYDLNDKIPSPKAIGHSASQMISGSGTKRTGISEKRAPMPEIAGATSVSGMNGLSMINGQKQKEDDSDLNREEFGRLLEKVGLGEDQMLIDKLFWVFDEDGSGNIGHKELAIGLEMLKDNTFQDKLEVFFDLCDEDGSGTISKKEFYNLLRLNATTSYEDRDRLKFYVNQIFNHYYDT